MSLRPLPLPPEVPGRLWLAAMPGRFEPWPAFQRHAQRHALTLVVCLTPRLEISELAPQYHSAIAGGRLPFRWLHVPLPNYGVPDEPQNFRRAVATIADALRAGDSVLLHCAAGIGRTGTTAACVLKALGVGTEDALQQVRDAGSNPQNAQQSGLVEWF